MTTTPKFGIPLISSQQNQPEVTHNQMVLVLQAIVGGAIAQQNAPPGSPADGDCYVVGAAGTGAWAGHDNAIAIFFGGWIFVPGVDDDGVTIDMGADQLGLVISIVGVPNVWSGTAWAPAGGGSSTPPTYWDIPKSGPGCFMIGPDYLSVAGFQGWSSILGNNFKSAGKLYFEVDLITSSGGSGPLIGVGTAAMNVASYPGNGAGGWGINSNGQVFSGGGGSGTGGSAFSNGDTMGVEIDFTGDAISFFKNGVANGGITGITFAAAVTPAFGVNNTPVSGLLRTQAPFKYTVPSGAAGWD